MRNTTINHSLVFDLFACVPLTSVSNCSLTHAEKTKGSVVGGFSDCVVVIVVVVVLVSFVFAVNGSWQLGCRCGQFQGVVKAHGQESSYRPLPSALKGIVWT